VPCLLPNRSRADDHVILATLKGRHEPFLALQHSSTIGRSASASTSAAPSQSIEQSAACW